MKMLVDYGAAAVDSRDKVSVKPFMNSLIKSETGFTLRDTEWEGWASISRTHSHKIIISLWSTLYGTGVCSKLMQDVIVNTALMEACRSGCAEAARVLLDQGANVDQVFAILSNVVFGINDLFRRHRRVFQFDCYQASMTLTEL